MSIQKTIVDQITTGLLVLDDAGEVVYVNDAGATILGDTKNVLPGAHLQGLLPDLAGFLSIDPHQPCQQNFRVRCLDGRTAPLGCRTDPLRHPHTGRVDTLVVFQDLTELMPVRRLQSTEVIVGAFRAVAASLSHELRNPLFAVSTGLQLLEAECNGGPSSARILSTMGTDIRRIVEILDRLLRIGGRDPLPPSIREAEELIGQALCLQQDLINQRSIQMVVTVPPDLPTLSLEVTKVLWVLSCVLRYTLVASEHGALIHVRVSHTRGLSGSSIHFHFKGSESSDTIATVIELFELDEAQPVHLELVFAREIALGLGGDIRIAKESDIESEVTVTFPVQEEHEKTCIDRR